MENNNYESIKIDGYYHKAAAVRYDSNKKIRYVIASFMSRQLLDNCLSLMQKGTPLFISGTRHVCINKGYTCKGLRVKDENNGDGVHAIIYANDSNTIKVFKNENRVDKVFTYLKENTECGLIDEWKSYFYNELLDNGHIEECEGFDFTGKAPDILLMKDIDTDLLRNIKAIGLKNGSISLPVDDFQAIDANMTFLDIIEKLIIPNIEEEVCHYNIGDPISDIFKAPIGLNHEKKMFNRQMIIAQGLLNAVKSGVNSTFINCGMGVGKTIIGGRLSIAVLKEHFKKENARIGLMLPSHLLNKWIRELEDCFIPLGIKPTFHIISRFTDVDKLPKEPKGIEIIIFQKDITKRTYLREFSATKKHKVNNIQRFINNISVDVEKNEVIIESCTSLKLSEMKLAALRLEKKYGKKVILYTPQYNNDDEIEEYKIVTTSETIKSTFGKTNKAYDFSIKEIERIQDIVKLLEDTIKAEPVESDFKALEIDNPLVCPICGGAVYQKGKDLFDCDKYSLYEKVSPDKMTNDNRHCNHYIKADGTTLSTSEIQEIRRQNIDVIYTSKAVKNPYLDEEGNELTGEDLINAKKKGYGYTILLKKCNHTLWGPKDQKGYRDFDSAKYFYKRFGKGALDISIYDEVHQYARLSSQNKSFSYICKASKVNLALTGTLTGGKASDLFYLLWNLCPQKMVQLGFKYNELGRFIDMYGRRKRTTKTYLETYNKSGTGRTISGSWVKIPGIAPQIISNILSERMVSRTIDDMNIPMPKLKYIKHDVTMDEDLADGYRKLESDIVSFLRKNRGINIGAVYLNSLLSYPDMPNQEPIFAFDGDLYIV